MKKETNLELDEMMDKDMQEILGILREIPQVPVPAQFDLNLRRALLVEKTKKKTLLYKKMAAIAAVFAVGVTSVLFAQDGTSLLPADTHIKQEQVQDKDHRNEDVLISDSSLIDSGADVQSLAADNAPAVVDSKEVQTNKEPLSDLESNTAAKQRTTGEGAMTDGIAVAQAPETALPNAASPETAVLYDEQQPASAGGSHQGRSAFRSMSEFDNEAQQQITLLSQAITAVDAQPIMDVRTDISTEMADASYKLYQDLFQGKTVSVKKIEEKSLAGVQQTYHLTGNGNQIEAGVKATTEGITVNEPILDHGLWLNEQLKDCVFTLKGYTISQQDGSVTFNVIVLSNEQQHAVNELRSITWKKTES